MSEKNKHIILFHHLPKTGGLNIKKYIADELYKRNKNDTALEVMSCSIQMAETPNQEYFSWCSHLGMRRTYYNLIRNGYKNISSYTVIRNPIDRFVSAYNFCLAGGLNQSRWGKNYILNNFKKFPPDINEFINNDKILDFFIVNSQVFFRYIPQLMISPEKYNHILLYEDYRGSYGKLLDRLGIYNELAFESELNKSVPHFSIHDINKKSLEKLQEVYQRDIELHNRYSLK